MEECMKFTYNKQEKRLLSFFTFVQWIIFSIFVYHQYAPDMVFFLFGLMWTSMLLNIALLKMNGALLVYFYFLIQAFISFLIIQNTENR